MAIKINLLPTELKVSGGLSRILSVSRILGVISLAVFLVFGLGLGVFFVISSVQLNSLNSGNDALKSQVTSLKTSEAQLVVLKDRIAKIKTVQKIPTAVKNLVDFDPLVSSFSSSTVSEVDVDANKIATSINFRSNSDLASFVKAISLAPIFRSVTFSSFSFSPAGGYLIGLTAVPK